MSCPQFFKRKTEIEPNSREVSLRNEVPYKVQSVLERLVDDEEWSVHLNWALRTRQFHAIVEVPTHGLEGLRKSECPQAHMGILATG